VCGRSVSLPPVLLLGAGRMGGAMFAGWAARGLAPSVLVDPSMPAGLARPGDMMVPAVTDVPEGFAPAAVVLAIKPQMAATVLPPLAPILPAQSVVLSVLAGKTIAGLRALIGGGAVIVRAMPNTPAAIGQGITAACAAEHVSPRQIALCHSLLEAVGEVVWVDDEKLIDPITAVSGSGPAYVFLLAELLEQAAIEQGIPAGVARRLARKTVQGAGALLEASPEDASALRQAVTSPNGTTASALGVLMDAAAWPANIRAAVQAATARSRALA